MGLFVNDSPEERIWRLFLKNNAVTPLAGDGYFAGTAVISSGVVKRPYSFTKASSKAGGRVVTYNQISLATLFMNITPTISVYNPTTTHALLPALSAKYGIPITTSDIVSAVVDGANLPQTVTITASSTSKFFTGSVAVLVKTAGVDLSTLVATRTLSTLVDPITKVSGYQSAELLSWPLDFTAKTAALEAWLLALTVGSTTGWTLGAFANFALLLTEATGNTWVATSSGVANNAYRVYIDYNGLSTGYAGADTEYARVLVFTLSTGYCTNLRGKIFMHYNLPFSGS